MDSETPRVEGHDGLMWIRGSGVCRDWNGIRYKLGMSGKNVGATQLSMNVAMIPPGGVAGAHIHVDFEVMLYILEGRVRHEYGDGLVERVDHAAGDFIFIAPGVPHEVFNLSNTEPVVAVVARSSADEWDNIVPYERGARREVRGARRVEVRGASCVGRRGEKGGDRGEVAFDGREINPGNSRPDHAMSPQAFRKRGSRLAPRGSRVTPRLAPGSRTACAP